VRKIPGILVLIIPLLLFSGNNSIFAFESLENEFIFTLNDNQNFRTENNDNGRSEVKSIEKSLLKTSPLPGTTNSKSAYAVRNFYFSTNGNDSNSGTSPDQAWKSVSKLNSIISSLQPGDNILFERGGIWSEAEIELSNISGTASNPVIFSAYGSGASPVITGGKILTGGFAQNGNIWIHNSVGYKKTGYIMNNAGLLINNRFNRVAIHPNNDYYTTNSKGNNTLSDGSQNWTDNELVGGQVAVKAVNWAWSVGKISSNTSGSVNFSKLEYDLGKDQTFYFLQNVDKGLDQSGEWVYNNSSLKVYYTGNLNTQKVEFPVVDTLLQMKNASNIVFDGLEIRGANGILIDIQGGENIRFDNCSFRIAGTGIDINNTQKIFFTNSHFEYFHTNGITADGVGPMNIHDNSFRHMHAIKGMNNDYDDWSSSIAIEHNSGEVSVKYNTFDTVMIAFQTHWANADWYFERNVISDYSYILGDNAAVYCGGDWRTDLNKVIRKNIFKDAQHDMEATVGNHVGTFGHGVYWDYNSNGILVDSNTFINSNAAIYSNRNKMNKAIANKIVNSAKDLDDIWCNAVYLDNLIDGTDNIAHHTFTNNIFVMGSDPKERAFGYHSNPSKDFNWGSLTINNNIYQNPFGGNKIHREISDYSEKVSYTIAEACQERQFDCNSLLNPLKHTFADVSGISKEEFVRVAYNPSKKPSTIVLGHTYLDIDGNIVAGTIALEPYETRVLFFYSEEVINDDEKPTAPSGLRVTETSPNSLNLRWDASTDNNGVKGYNIFVNGVKSGTSGSTSKTITGLNANTEYSLEVSAYDFSSNESEKSETITATTSDIDRIPPTPPAGLEAISIEENSVTLSWNPSTDNVRVEGYRIYANGLRRATTTATNYTLDKLNPGIDYGITVTAFDAIGNESEPSDILEITTLTAEIPEEEKEKELPDVSIVKVINANKATQTIAKVSTLGKAEVEEFGVKVTDHPDSEVVLSNYSAKPGDFRVVNQNRVTKNLQLLYNFSHGHGFKITDLSGNEEPVDLYIDRSSRFKWLPGQGIKVLDTSVIASREAPVRLMEALKKTNEITIETWIKPSQINQAGPARIVSLSSDNFNRAVTLGQTGNAVDFDYVIRLNTTGTNLNGNPEGLTSAKYNQSDFHHLVYTRDKAGNEKIFVNGTEIYSGFRAGNFSSWDNSYQFSLANELSGERPWLGTYFLVAVYNKALNPNEIQQNFEAGYGDLEFTTSFEGLNPSTSYYLKPFARTQKGIKFGQSINILTPVKEPEPGILKLTTYPNPSNGNFRVYFEHSIKDARNAWLRVSDMHGKVLYYKDILVGDIFFGKEEFISLDSGNLKDGIYILTLNIGDEILSRQLVIRQ
jgi:chitodextrinase